MIGQPADQENGTPQEEPAEEPASSGEETGSAPAAEPEEREYVAAASAKAAPSLITTATIYQGKKKLSTYSRPLEYRVNMGDDKTYLNQPHGILTFRASSFRKNAAEGTVGELTEMSVKWRAEMGSAKGKDRTYYGAVWNSQPLIMRLTQQVRESANIVEEKRSTKNLREVIMAGEDGKIYFLDLEDGAKTREPINLGFPMRSTPSVSSDGYPYMTVGQYARSMKNATGKIVMTMTGMTKDSNCEARTKYTRPSATISASVRSWKFSPISSELPPSSAS